MFMRNVQKRYMGKRQDVVLVKLVVRETNDKVSRFSHKTS